ncbi:hypothetical protein [Actinomycetospora sp.]|jgi:hypothetical protein|uniref:hypothetical protein n=1 Tax=Actinomycetospora sp. TaxID=1872135 RepID=UPI002F3F9440
METSPIDQAHAVADTLFDRDAAAYGDDLGRYHGHVHRVIGLVGLQSDVPDDLAYPLGVAAYYHDAAIWLDDTWDYLPPSSRRAVAELEGDAQQHGRLVADLIEEHHRVRAARSTDPLVESFRRADLTDVSRAVLAPGVSRSGYRDLVRRFPDTGFRRMLLGAFVRGVRADPWHPAPMLKL